jgi:hypothetical protein
MFTDHVNCADWACLDWVFNVKTVIGLSLVHFLIAFNHGVAVFVFCGEVRGVYDLLL